MGSLQTAMLASSAAVIMTAASPAIAQAQTRSYAIAAQDLPAALRIFALESGRDVVFDPATVRGKTSVAVNGVFTDEAALQRLLERTGLTFRRTPSGGFVVEGAGVAAADLPSDATTEIAQLVVTGSYIRGGTPASAVLSVTRSDIDASGLDSAGALIRLLPQAFGGGHQSSVVGAGGQAQLNNHAFADSPNLRGLGSDATLTLVDGHRVAPAATGHATDVSIIPLSLVERVDVLTDGASALYGSDAVGGVVNFVLRKRFDGAQTSADLSTTTRGGGTTYRLSHLSGQTWSTGGVMLGVEYVDRERLGADERGFSSLAPRITDLAPDYTQKLLFSRVEQDLGERAAVHATAMFSEKDVVRQSGSTGATTTTTVDVQQPNVLLGGHLFLNDDWRLRLNATWGRDRTQTFSQFGAGSFSEGRSRYERYSVEAVADGPVLDLPGGSLKAAIGAGWRHEDLRMGTRTAAQTVLQASTRRVSHVFGQLEAPLIGPDNQRPGVYELIATASARYEHMSDVGDKLVPRLGIVYRVTPDWALRSTWGKSFKAPSLVQLSASAQAFVTDLPDPLAGGRPAPVLFRTLGSDGLEPETSDSLSVGVDWTPGKWEGLRVSLNYFKIDYDGRITQPVIPLTAALSNPAYASLVVRNPSPALQQQVIAASDRFQNFSAQPYDPARVVAYVFNAYQNVSSQKIEGVDLSARYATDLYGGRLALRFDATWMKIRQQLTPDSPVTETTGTITNAPNWKLRAGAIWTGERLFGALFANYVGELDDPTTIPAFEVNDHLTLDGQVGVSIGSTRLALSVENLLDASPPVITAGATTPARLRFDATNASPFGRILRLSLTQRW